MFVQDALRGISWTMSIGFVSNYLLIVSVWT